MALLLQPGHDLDELDWSFEQRQALCGVVQVQCTPPLKNPWEMKTIALVGVVLPAGAIAEWFAKGGKISAAVIAQFVGMNFDQVEAQIPSSWGPGKPTSKNEGWRWGHPTNRGVGLRIMGDNPLATDMIHRGPYLRITDAAGRGYRIPLAGNPILAYYGYDMAPGYYMHECAGSC
jgi:hypothetical protein